MKVYVSRYTLTTGEIEEFDVPDDAVIGKGVLVLKRKGFASMVYRVGRDVFLSKQEAFDDVAVRTVKEIVFMRKKIGKLQLLNPVIKKVPS